MISLNALPITTISLRTWLEVALLCVLVALGVSTVTYRALYKAESAKCQASASEAAKVAAEAQSALWSEIYRQREEQLQKDKALADQATKDAERRALRAESALAKARSDRNDEAQAGGCLNESLSPRTVERLHRLEQGYIAERKAGESARPQ